MLNHIFTMKIFKKKLNKILLLTSSLSILLLSNINAIEKGTEQPTGTDANIFGHVIDRETDEHIPFINVIIDGTRIGTTTDASGHYMLTNLPVGEHTLIVKGMGFEPDTVNFEIEEDQTKEINIKLEYTGVELDEVVLTASPTASGFRYQPDQSFIGEELQRRSEVSFGEMLDGEPGIAMRSMGPTPSRPVIRGLGGDRILILQDGERMGDIAETAPDHAISLDPLAASRVEVVRGPASLLYGSSALGGVINVMTSDIPEEWTHGSTGVLSAQGATVNNMGAGFGRFTHGNEKWAATGRMSYKSAGNVNTPIGEIPSTSLQNYDGALGFGFENEKVNGGFAVSMGNQTFELPEEGAIEDDDETVEIRADRQLLQGRLNFKISDFFDKAQLRFNSSRFFQEEVEIEEGVEEKEIEFEKYNVSSTLTAQHQARGIFDRGAIGLSLQGHNMDVGGHEAYTPGEDRYTMALFTFQEVPLSGMLRLQIGARLDYQNTTAVPNELFPDIDKSRDALNYSGSVGLNIRPSEGIEIGAQFARSHRNPSTEELFADGPHIGAGVYEAGYINLKDEIGHGGDLFIKWNNGKFSGEIAGFINHFQNFIIFDPSGETDEESGYHIFNYLGDEARLMGGEVLFRWELIDGLEWGAGVDYVNGKRCGEVTEYLPYIPPFRFKTELEYDYGNGWVATKINSAANKTNLAEHEEQTDGYTIIGAQAGYRIDHGGRHVIILRAENILDNEYRNHLSRIGDRNIPMPGRNFNLAYRYYF